MFDGIQCNKELKNEHTWNEHTILYTVVKIGFPFCKILNGGLMFHFAVELLSYSWKNGTKDCYTETKSEELELYEQKAERLLSGLLTMSSHKHLTTNHQGIIKNQKITKISVWIKTSGVGTALILISNASDKNFKKYLNNKKQCNKQQEKGQ